jgi:hypothetical protein
MKFSELQKHEINESHAKASRILNEIKQKPLKGKALEEMKVLEVAVQHLELFQIMMNK